jgi:hypothetical protein
VFNAKYEGAAEGLARYQLSKDAQESGKSGLFAYGQAQYNKNLLGAIGNETGVFASSAALDKSLKLDAGLTGRFQMARDDSVHEEIVSSAKARGNLNTPSDSNYVRNTFAENYMDTLQQNAASRGKRTVMGAQNPDTFAGYAQQAAEHEAKMQVAQTFGKGEALNDALKSQNYQNTFNIARVNAGDGIRAESIKADTLNSAQIQQASIQKATLDAADILNRAAYMTDVLNQKIGEKGKEKLIVEVLRDRTVKEMVKPDIVKMWKDNGQGDAVSDHTYYDKQGRSKSLDGAFEGTFSALRKYYVQFEKKAEDEASRLAALDLNNLAYKAKQTGVGSLFKNVTYVSKRADGQEVTNFGFHIENNELTKTLREQLKKMSKDIKEQQTVLAQDGSTFNSDFTYRTGQDVLRQTQTVKAASEKTWKSFSQKMAERKK